MRADQGQGGPFCGRAGGASWKGDGKMRIEKGGTSSGRGAGGLSVESECGLRLGWVRPRSAGAESDFDLALSLVGSAVARTRELLCSRPHQPWLACSIRRTWYIQYWL
jgi:hypothetical protein